MKLEAALSILSVRLNSDPSLEIQIEVDDAGMKTAVLVRPGIDPVVIAQGQAVSLGGALLALGNAAYTEERFTFAAGSRIREHRELEG